MKKLFFVATAAVLLASCGAEKEEGKKEGKEEGKKEEVSKIDKIAEDFCACADLEVAEMETCMQEFEAKHSDVSKEDQKAVLSKVKDCQEKMMNKMKAKMEADMNAAQDSLVENTEDAVENTVEEVKQEVK